MYQQVKDDLAKGSEIYSHTNGAYCMQIAHCPVCACEQLQSLFCSSVIRLFTFPNHYLGQEVLRILDIRFFTGNRRLQIFFFL